MRNKISKIVMLTLCAAALTGCQNQVKKPVEAPEKVQESVRENVQEQVQESAQKVQQQEPEPVQENMQELQKLTLYMPNEMADGFVTEVVELPSVTQNEILNQLKEKKVVPEEAEILSCEETEVDGVSSLNLNMNKAFGEYMQSMGTAGEYVTLGSVVNTFLDAYGCEQIKITIEGNSLMTGHAEYTDYMGKYE